MGGEERLARKRQEALVQKQYLLFFMRHHFIEKFNHVINEVQEPRSLPEPAPHTEPSSRSRQSTPPRSSVKYPSKTATPLPDRSCKSKLSILSPPDSPRYPPSHPDLRSLPARGPSHRP